MKNIEIKDLPELVDTVSAIMAIVKEGRTVQYTMARDGSTELCIDPPLATVEGPLQEELFQAAVEHTATFKALLKERDMKLVDIADPECDKGYFYISVIKGEGDDQTLVNIHSDSDGWSQTGESITALNRWQVPVREWGLALKFTVLKWFYQVRVWLKR